MILGIDCKRKYEALGKPAVAGRAPCGPLIGGSEDPVERPCEKGLRCRGYQAVRVPGYEIRREPRRPLVGGTHHASVDSGKQIPCGVCDERLDVVPHESPERPRQSPVGRSKYPALGRSGIA